MKNTEQQLAWESNNRQWALIAAVAGMVLPIVSVIFVPLLLTGTPPNNTPANVLYIGENSTVVIVQAVVNALAVAAAAVTMVYLYRAIKARNERFLSLALVCTIIGALAVTVGTLLVANGLITGASDFKHTAKTYEQARDVLTFANDGLGLFAQNLGRTGSAAVGLAFILISLNAFRVGLIGRVPRVVGIIIGALDLLGSLFAGASINPLSLILQIFWLGAIAIILSGRWPQRVPPAWRSGKAEPWPTMRELREQAQPASDD